MCIKGVLDFLRQKGCLPYQLLGKIAPTSDIVSTKKEATDDRIVIEYALHAKTTGEEQKQGSLYFALPAAGPFSIGCDIKIQSTNGTCDFHARLVPRSELENTISAATGQVIHIWSSKAKQQLSIQLLAVPGQKYVLNDKPIV
jgi:hypothetical protein